MGVLLTPRMGHGPHKVNEAQGFPIKSQVHLGAGNLGIGFLLVGQVGRISGLELNWTETVDFGQEQDSEHLRSSN